MSIVDHLAHDGLLLRCLRPLLQTEELALVAVNSCGAAYFYVAPELACLESVALAAVSRDGRVLQAVPTPSVTEAVCHAAVCQNFRAFKYVPESLRTQAVLHAYVYAYDAQVNRRVPVDAPDVSAAFRFFHSGSVDDDESDVDEWDEEDYDW